MNHGTDWIMAEEKLVRKRACRPADTLVWHGRGEVPFLSFPLLDEQPWLLNGFSTRLGGVTPGKIGSLNLAFSREKSRENVEENFRRIAGAIGFPPESMVFSQQTHTTNIRYVTDADAGNGYLRELKYRDVDGLITDSSHVTLVTFYADCVPLLAADPVHRVIGAAHSGWKGTVRSIGAELVKAMTERFGTDPADLVTVIGPSICQSCYEVSEDVADRFREAYAKHLHPLLLQDRGNGKYLLNLQEACRQNFLSAGVREDRISLPDLCTCCNSQVLFSHRASQGERGLLAAFLKIRD